MNGGLTEWQTDGLADGQAWHVSRRVVFRFVSFAFFTITLAARHLAETGRGRVEASRAECHAQLHSFNGHLHSHFIYTTCECSLQFQPTEFICCTSNKMLVFILCNSSCGISRAAHFGWTAARGGAGQGGRAELQFKFELESLIWKCLRCLKGLAAVIWSWFAKWKRVRERFKFCSWLRFEFIFAMHCEKVSKKAQQPAILTEGIGQRSALCRNCRITLP